MKIKRIVFGFLTLSLLACNFVTQMIFPPTATPIPTVTATASPTPTATPFVPAFIPPECAAAPIATIPPELAVQATPEIENEDIALHEQLASVEEVG
ncbi:MAG: hypothetical protein WCC12_10455 [Anaerolineales bacterium]